MVFGIEFTEINKWRKRALCEWVVGYWMNRYSGLVCSRLWLGTVATEWESIKGDSVNNLRPVVVRAHAATHVVVGSSDDDYGCNVEQTWLKGVVG